MKSLVYTSIAISALAVAMPAQAANESASDKNISSLESRIGAIDAITEDSAKRSRRGNLRGGNFGNRGFSRFGGFGFGSYIRPFIGFRLPTFWVSPTYFIPNYTSYNLVAPSNGLLWSRYYNDAVLRDQQGFVRQTVPNIQWQDGSNAFQNGQPMPIEGQVYSWNEGSNVGGAPIINQNINNQTFPGQRPNGPINGSVNPGTAIPSFPDAPSFPEATNAPGAPFPQQPDFEQTSFPQQQVFDQAPQQNFSDEYEQCLRRSGVTGAALGALLGGVAGNRIAGRNNRTAGTLIGGGVGALGGLGIDKATDNCKQFLNEPVTPVQQFPQQQFPQQQFPQQQFPQGQVQQFPQQQFPQQQFFEPQDGEYARCLRKRGITGTVLGGLLGGFAGNRIDSSNSRLAGTLIGGTLGAITGKTIEKATRKCEKKRLNRGNNQIIGYYQPQVQYYWVSPGYYYPQGTTTVTIHQQAVQQEVVYEETGKRLTKPAKRLKKPQR